jgi:hypothetical protein
MPRRRTPFAKHKSYNDESVSNSEGALRKEELTVVCLFLNTASRIPITI